MKDEDDDLHSEKQGLKDKWVHALDVTPSPSDLQETPVWSQLNTFVTMVPPKQGKTDRELARSIANLDVQALDDIIAGRLPDVRYLRIKHIGRGGMGEVSLMRDTLLRREVALKVPLPRIQEEKTLLRAFVVEALLTAQLEHPNIISSYDMVVQGGQVGFVMRRLKGERLSQILTRLAYNEEDLLEIYGRVRLLTIFQQIVSAVAYAHDRNIIHRDLKPANVMVGLYGEVQVIDWGLALYLGPHGSGVEGRGLKGAKVGQAPYMSPEQYLGNDDATDYRSDIFSLGALLFELLTLEKLHLPRDEEDVDTYMERCRTATITAPSRRSPHRKISENLNSICMKCLETNPEDRYQSASDLLSDVILELEGSIERDFARRAAKRALEQAIQLAQKYEDSLDQVKLQTRQTMELRIVVKGHDPIEQKRILWGMEDELKKQEYALSVAFHGAEHAFHQAIGNDSSYKKAKKHLQEFYYQRFLREESERGSGKEYFAARVNSYNDPIYNERMKGDGSLELTSYPEGAVITFMEFESVDRVLQPGKGRVLGKTPLKVPCPMGSYLLSITHPGRETVKVPIQIGRLESVSQSIYLPKEGRILEGFVCIPGGPFMRGGDLEARNGLDGALVHVDGFAIAKFPVTYDDYLVFMNDIWLQNPELARDMVPLDNNTGEAFWPGGHTTPYRIPETDKNGQAIDPLIPINTVSWKAATYYANWLGERLGASLRLPTGDEWEKAGRGADGRYYPWGNHWDTGFCKNTNSRSSHPRPEPIGAYPQDTSPYGVRDMAGGVHEWCQDWFSKEAGTRVVRGGSWAGPSPAHRMASRYFFWEQSGHEGMGFRLVYSLEDKQ